MELKKILLINASKRKKNTLNLLKSFEDVLKAEGFSTEILCLGDYKIDFCLGCEQCVRGRPCPLKDDVSIILDKIISCDGIVIGTPVYLNNMSGMLKTLVDRTCSWFHRSPVAQKPVFLIVDTKGSGVDNTVRSINEFLIQWGTCITGCIKRTSRNCANPVLKSDAKNFIDLVNADGKGYKPSFKEVQVYNVQKVLCNNIFPEDKVYWTDRKWINLSYYPEAKLSIFKKLYGNMIFNMLKKVIKPI